MRLWNRNGRPTALAALLIGGVATLGCGSKAEQGDDQGEVVEGTADRLSPDRPTPGRAGTLDDLDGDPGDDAISHRVGISSHEPTGTYLDPAPIESPPAAAPGVELPVSSGTSDAVGAAGAANAQGAAAGASSSPEEAAATGSAPAGSNATAQPDDPPTDDPVDGRP